MLGWVDQLKVMSIEWGEDGKFLNWSKPCWYVKGLDTSHKCSKAYADKNAKADLKAHWHWLPLCLHVCAVQITILTSISTAGKKGCTRQPSRSLPQQTNMALFLSFRGQLRMKTRTPMLALKYTRQWFLKGILRPQVSWWLFCLWCYGVWWCLTSPRLYITYWLCVRLFIPSVYMQILMLVPRCKELFRR